MRLIATPRTQNYNRITFPLDLTLYNLHPKQFYLAKPVFVTNNRLFPRQPLRTRHACYSSGVEISWKHHGFHPSLSSNPSLWLIEPCAMWREITFENSKTTSDLNNRIRRSRRRKNKRVIYNKDICRIFALCKEKKVCTKFARSDIVVLNWLRMVQFVTVNEGKKERERAAKCINAFKTRL